MNYTQFKSFLATFLWKQNDTDLIAKLDSLILMANAELNSKLDLQRRETTLLATVENVDYNLPADYRNMVSVNYLDGNYAGGLTNTTALDIYKKRAVSRNASFVPLYCVDQGATSKVLRLVGPYSVATPGSFVILYRANVPDFAATDASWLETDYLDLYVYTILSHTAPFLREDERLTVWMELKNTAIDAAIQDDKARNVFGGSPMRMQPHRQVP
jgi:hypothetical protein